MQSPTKGKERISQLLPLDCLLSLSLTGVGVYDQNHIPLSVVESQKAKEPTSLDLPLTDPGFFPALFALLARRTRDEGSARADSLRRILLDDFLELSDQLDKAAMQESVTVRHVLRTRALALLLINDEGELDQELLVSAEKILSQTLYIIGPQRLHDGVRRRHILSIVRRLQNDKELRQLLRLISKPQSHRLADQTIRDTLQLPSDIAVTDTHARRAVLSAWLCYLRQNVGSCFATAPAIIIHDEQPHLFLKDLNELLGTGRLRRTYGGVEYVVPFSSTWGAGDLRRRFALFRPKEGEPLNPVCQSPGILDGLRAVGLDEGDGPFAQERVVAAVQALVGDRPYAVCTAEDIIRQVLLTRHEITAEDVTEYEQRPKPMMQSGIVMHMPAGSKVSGKGQRCEQFLQALERACSGFKSLTDNALLRVWEFTLASFSEIKSDFARWNLYSSLGMRADEPGGIGAELYAIVQHKLDMANRKVHEFQDEYEQIYGQVKFLEGRLRSASTEQEIRWMRSEYQTKVNEFHTFEEMREKALAKARRYANLFSALIDIYLRLFPDYFQEVYDADLHEVDVGPYDDSPAGFRLLFKHGRPNTALWTLIRNHTQFIEALASFFILSEAQVASMPEVEGLDQDLGEIITAIVNHIKSDNFMLSALVRMAQAHRGRLVEDPLKNIEKIEKKPWAYTSGGTMDTLVACYYKREEKPTEVGRWVENEVELLVFLLDTVKKIPAKVADPYLNDSSKSLLIHSPTHAFLLRPGFSPFREGVRDNTYTYIWVRDQIVQPMTRFVEGLSLDREMIMQLLAQLDELIPQECKATFQTVFSHIPGRMKATEFPSYVMKELTRYRALHWHGMPILQEEQVDSLLYRSLPMSHGYQTRLRVQKLLEALPGMTDRRVQALMRQYDSLMPASAVGRVVSADRLRDVVKSLLCLERRSVLSAQDDHLLVAQAAQSLGFAMPTPVLFADTNWVTDYFGFVVSPGSGRFELWRLDYTGTTGAPMLNWKEWLDGSRRDRTWGVYLRPNEYSM